MKDEIGDVVMVITHLADKLGIDPLQAAFDKLSKLEQKYPIEECKGKIDKHTEYNKG